MPTKKELVEIADNLGIETKGMIKSEIQDAIDKANSDLTDKSDEPSNFSKKNADNDVGRCACGGRRFDENGVAVCESCGAGCLMKYWKPA